MSGDFIDLLSLLPSSKDFLFKNDKKDDRSDDDRRRPVTRNFNNWLQAYCIYCSVLCSKYPEKSVGLFQHLDIVLEAYKNFGGISWFTYDESFRQKVSVHPTLRWGCKDVGLWLNLFLPQRSYVSKSQPPPSTAPTVYKKGICFSFNDSQCRWPGSCRFRHECAFCAGAHPIAKCFKKMAFSNQPQNREPFLKSVNASELNKNAPLASNIHRSADGSSLS